MDRITFTINGVKYSVGSEVDSDVSLNDYVRNELNLRGSKYMCKEGGCGACIMAVSATDRDGHHRTFAVNSCLVSITSCQNWDVTTIEGIGNRGIGYHPIQKTLAEYNGTQCGYCSPGWVMNMYCLLESSHGKLTQYEIENSFGSNTCRCTGYRPILDAFKSFAKDAPKPKLNDIEDLNFCKAKNCKSECDKNWCIVNKSDVESGFKKIKLKDERIWYRVTGLEDVFTILDKEGYDSYMLVNGNTARGAVPIFSFPKILIDISPIQEIKGYFIDQNLVIGAGTTLTDLLELFSTISKNQEEFAYLQKFYDHLDLVAHIPVRNIGTIAGNLMAKHRDPRFASDVFLLFESVGGILEIVYHGGTIEVSPEKFLTLDMSGRVIAHVKLPPLSSSSKFTSFKVMSRSQNTHAQVNGAFLYKFSNSKELTTVHSASIVFGGLSGEFNHARKTEEYLVNKKVFTNEVLQEALKVLQKEIVVKVIPGDLEPEYRKKCALGIFYKGLLDIIPKENLKPIYRSGSRDLKQTRPLSKGTEVYDTNPIIWPINEPMPKIDALIQCAGEANYVNDMPTQPKEAFCAFVTSDVAVGEIESIDPTAALKLPGVLAFLSAKDIPGKNSFLSLKVLSQFVPEEIFSEKTVKYYDQPIGLIVAETEKLANRAALLVRVKYRNVKKPLLTIKDVREQDPSRVSLLFLLPARDRGLNVQRVIKGGDNIFGQYHFTMETQTTVARPSEDGLDVFCSTQWPDQVHNAISESLNIELSRLNLTIPRCGGGYGSKITRAAHTAAACSLASYLLNRPVRFVMSIQANMRVVGKRLPSTSDYEVGIDNSGRIQYLEYHLFDDNGYVFSDLVLPLGIPALKNCYDNRRWQSKFFNVTTDTASNTFARAPGELEAISLTEYIMERISYEIDRDPVEVRLNNLEPTYLDVRNVVDTVLVDSEYYKRKEEVASYNKLNRWKKKGLRVAFTSWPCSLLIDFHILLTVYHGDGSVVISHGGVEMGQGINTKVIQVVAYTLNISMRKIKIKPTTVEKNPNNFTDGASRTTQSVCFGAIKCCQIILDRLSTIRETLNDPTWEFLIAAAYNAGINLQSSYRVTANDQEVYRSACAVVTEVELDILTGEYHILRVDIVEDVGLSVNPELDIGQVEGAFMMGIGYWTHERLIYEENTGELLTDRTWYYHVPLAKDIPIDFRVKLRRNSFNPVGTLGAKAVSEPPICLTISVAFALREAIAASREDTGFPRNQWFQVDGPHTVAVNVLKADVRIDEFLYY